MQGVAFPLVAIALGSNLCRSDSVKLPLVLAVNNMYKYLKMFYVSPIINGSVMPRALAKEFGLRVVPWGRPLGH